MLWTRNSLLPAPLFDADGSGNAGNGGGSGGDQDPVRQFKQSELDAMFGERAKQARSAAVTDLLKDLGVESPDRLTTIRITHR